MDDVVLVDAARTPIGKRNGSLASTPMLETCWERCSRQSSTVPASTRQQSSQVIGGCVQQVGMQSGNVVRTAWLGAGLPLTVPSTTVNVQCGSGQQATDAGPRPPRRRARRASRSRAASRTCRRSPSARRSRVTPRPGRGTAPRTRSGTRRTPRRSSKAPTASPRRSGSAASRPRSSDSPPRTGSPGVGRGPVRHPDCSRIAA